MQVTLIKQTKIRTPQLSILPFSSLCQPEPSGTTSDAAVDLCSFKNVQHLELPKVNVL